MDPKYFLSEVVTPNVVEAHSEPGDMRRACNAILSLDACAGILFQHLRQTSHDVAAAFHDDSSYRDSLADQCVEFRIVRDTAFSLKHGVLTGRKPRIISAASSVAEDANRFGYMRVGDEIGGSLIYLDLHEDAPVKRVRADDQIIDAKTFLAGIIDALT